MDNDGRERTALDMDHLIGNREVKGYLLRMLKTGRMGHLLLFTGPAGVGKGLFAEVFAKAVVGTEGLSHPDIRSYRPEGKLAIHSLESMRRLGEDLTQSPYASKRGVFIVYEADRMLPTSANALLKSLEEPHPSQMILLVSHAPHCLLPTIVSRCCRIPFQPVAEEELIPWLQQVHQKSLEEASKIAAEARGSVAKALKLAGGGEPPERAILLHGLASGKMRTYQELRQWIAQLAGTVESRREEREERLKQQQKEAVADITALQRQSLEKEIEGTASLHYLEEVEELLRTILSWYRDMHLISLNGNRIQLIHRDQLHALEQAVQRGLLLPLEKVEQSLADVRLAVARSSALSTSLEALFLTLGFL